MLWVLFVLLAIPSVYWRDGGEFVLSAALLDIPHVGGFPVYNMLANLFTLIPIGPIAWRVHLFSAAISTLHIALLGSLIQRIAALDFGCSQRAGFLLGTFSALLLLSSDAYLRQSLTAEVYVLNSSFILLLLLIAHTYLHTKDHRLLVLLAFVGALALGNHLSIAAVIGFGCLILTFTARSAVVRILWIAMLVTALGLGSYLYLPIRAEQTLALNTGTPTIGPRLVRYLTNARDRELRPQSQGPAISAPGALLHRLESDGTRLADEISPFLLVAGAIGGLLLLFRTPRMGLLVLSTGIGNYLFFQGWESDPWIPVFACTYLGVGVLLAGISARVSSERRQAAVALVLLFIISLPASPDALLSLTLTTEQVQRYEAPIKEAERLLLAQRPSTVLGVESLWFPIRYLHALEGLRSDLITVHTPQLLYPKLFTLLDLTSGGERLQAQSFTDTGDTSFFSSFIGYVIRRAPLVFEPSALVNTRFRDIGILRSDGMIELQYGVQGRVDETFTPISLGRNERQTLALSARDALRTSEMRLSGLADFLAQKARPDMAATLLEELCGAQDEVPCSPITRNNLGVYFLRAGRAKDAERIFQHLIQTSPSLRGAAQKNLETLHRVGPEGTSTTDNR